MTVVVVLLVVAALAAAVVAFLVRRGHADPLQTVDGFARALSALAPDDADAPRRRGRRRAKS